MTRGAAAPRREQVFFSSRSGHSKTKAVKETEVQHHEHVPSDKASETSSKRRISTVASLRAVKNAALPNSKAHIPSTERERSGSNGSSTLWGSLSTVGGHSNGPNPYAPHRDSNTAVDAISSTISSSARPSSELGHHSHSEHPILGIHPGLSIRTEPRRGSESRLSQSSARSSGSLESAVSAASDGKDSKFWDEIRISHTVTEDFIEEALRRTPGTESLVSKLRQPVAFGDGLTETTYSEWIVSRARKFFLILVDLGIPEQVCVAISFPAWFHRFGPMKLSPCHF